MMTPEEIVDAYGVLLQRALDIIPMTIPTNSPAESEV